MTQPKTKFEQPELIIKGGEELSFFSTLILITKKGAKIMRTIKGEDQQIGHRLSTLYIKATSMGAPL